MIPYLRNCIMIASALLPLHASADGLQCAGSAPKRAATAVLSSTGQVRALVLFARFQDESGSATAPAFAADLFDPSRPGSLTHFFTEMSTGQFVLTGEVLPRVYASASPMSRYLSAGAAGRGEFGRFTREILAAADADVDFGAFDNDGPDGIPNSGDDDGSVDLLLVVTQSTPSGFIVGDADGVAQLGLDTPYLTQDAASDGRRISVRQDKDTPGGTLQRGLSFADAVGIIAHEMGHMLGLPDLYDRVNTRGSIVDDNDASAGIGYWGLMGHGARGWDDRGGPTPLCSWSRLQLGWLGVANAQLAVVATTIDDAFLGDVNRGGTVYQLPLPDGEYLLIEHRSADGSYYERHLPAEGVLIWHVDPDRPDNDDEYNKRVDLICADGLFLDAGYPQGVRPGLDVGQDNLDFYSSDADFRAGHAGNLGDATDVFDGGRFTEYTPLSNPAINGVSISDIRGSGAGFSADLVVRDRRRAGLLTGRDVWRDTIHIVGDVTIAAGASVDLAPGTVIRVAADGRHSGADPERVEIVVEGTLSSAGATSVFESASALAAPGDWVGLSTTASGLLSLGSTTFRQAQQAIVVRGGTRGLSLAGVSIEANTGDGIRVTSVSGRTRLLRVTVEGAGGNAVTIDGGDPVTAEDLRLIDNAGHGFTRKDGNVTLTHSELARNGAAAGGYDLWLREGSSGTVSDTRLTGSGEGARLELTGGMTLTQNEWTGYRVALRTRSATPIVRANVFSHVDTVLSAMGFRVPTILQLNVINEPQVLVANETAQTVDAARNWWGTTETAAISSGMSGFVNWDPPLNFDPRLPMAFALAQNFPNPFNGATVIDFSVSLLNISLSAGQPMDLDVRTITGGMVRHLFTQEAAPGIYRVIWDGLDESGHPAASGVYFYELSVGPIRLLRRLTVLR